MIKGTDVKLDNNFDLEIGPDGDLVMIDSFDTALIISIYCERRATEAEMKDSTRRRGWIGNELTPGFEIGSKLWLLRQSRVTGVALKQAEDYLYSALQWLVDEGHLDSVQLSTRVASNAVYADVTLTQDETRSFKLWANTGIS